MQAERSAVRHFGVDRLLKPVLEISPGLAGKQDLRGPITTTGFGLAWLAFIASSFMHAAFEAERVWRMVLTKPHHRMPFHRRAGKSTLVPYIELELNRDSKSEAVTPFIIKEVMVSPTPDPSLSVEALKSLFCRSGTRKLISGGLLFLIGTCNRATIGACSTLANPSQLATGSPM